jgi:hypothetical protein
MKRRIAPKPSAPGPPARPFKEDCPRAIDEYIDYFGGGHGRRGTVPPAALAPPATLR